MSIPNFGHELRRLRVEAGISLRELGALIHYTKGYISRIETGDRTANAPFARACDQALSTGGTLTQLLAETPRPAEADDDTGEEPPQWLATAGTGWITPDDAVDPLLAEPFATILAGAKILGQRGPTRSVLPTVMAQITALRGMIAQAPPGHPLLPLAARYAEYASWLVQETGDHAAARRWTDHARLLADRAGDHGLAAYIRVRLAELAMYQGDAAATIAHARAAHNDPTASDRTRALAAHREAQGHALVYDVRGVDEALDRARAWQPAPAPAGADGSSTITDLDAVATGWCLYELGRYDRAAEHLEQGWSSIDPASRRARGIFGGRLALAHLAAGDVDRACAVGHEVFGLARRTDSATAYAQLRLLAHHLHRRRGYQPALELYTDLSTLLPR